MIYKIPNITLQDLQPENSLFFVSHNFKGINLYFRVMMLPGMKVFDLV